MQVHEQGQIMNELTQLDNFAQKVFENAKNKGFWEEERNKSEQLMLVVSELAEMQEALRSGNPQSTKIPDFLLIEEEAADVVIRMMDLCVGHNWRLSEAIIAKYKYNVDRPHKHGKKF